MADIRIVTCGRMTFCLPNGNMNRADLFSLYYYKENGAVIAFHASDRAHTLKAGDTLLRDTLSAINKLIADASDCPCEKRPFFNEVYMDDSTYRYVPREKLYELLEKLYRSAEQNNNWHELPAPAGVVPMMPKPPKPEIQAVDLDDEGQHFRLKVNGDSARLDVVYPTGEVVFYKFPVSHKAFRRFESVAPMLRLSDTGTTNHRHEITYADGTKSIADKVKLLTLITDLQTGLEDDTENVETGQLSPPTTLQGAVIAPIQNNCMMGLTGGTVPFTSPAAPPAPPAAKASLNDDGSWNCSCGTNGLTSRFCYSCGAAKPVTWKCSCGAENTSKFCNNCGKPRP
ncbi:MAG: hypothetical protein IKO47_04860 [Ruminococcus sp.]|nr:hypothetical protein [Ruminococcus sp.]